MQKENNYLNISKSANRGLKCETYKSMFLFKKKIKLDFEGNQKPKVNFYLSAGDFT